MGRLRCWLGLHRWKMVRHEDDGFWALYVDRCRRCGALR